MSKGDLFFHFLVLKFYATIKFCDSLTKKKNKKIKNKR